MKKVTLALALAAVALSQAGQFANAQDGFARRHPRRAEVMRRDGRLNNGIRADRGHLGGQYNNLMAQDRSIRQQQRADARANGGYITRGQRRQLNGEENQLRRNIYQDSH